MNRKKYDANRIEKVDFKSNRTEKMQTLKEKEPLGLTFVPGLPTAAVARVGPAPPLAGGAAQNGSAARCPGRRRHECARAQGTAARPLDRGSLPHGRSARTGEGADSSTGHAPPQPAVPAIASTQWLPLLTRREKGEG